jgi:hypothetical protein
MRATLNKCLSIWTLEVNEWFMVHGSWFMVHGSWFMVQSLEE